MRRWYGFVAALIAGVVSAIAWPHLPPRVASHWNLHGVADGWSSRTWAAYFGPVMILAITLVMQVLPKIDPRRRNYAKFWPVFWLVVNLIITFIFVLHLALMANGMGAGVNPVVVIGIALGVMMIVIGNYLSRVRPNWFIGIRTPWTLESPEVWRKTHKVGGWLFVTAGVLTLASIALIGPRGMMVAFVSVMTAAVGSALLSLVFWMQEQKQKGKGES